MPTKGQLIAEGTYTFQRGETSIGHATWQFSKLAHGGLLFDSHVTLTHAPPSTHHFTYEVTQHWLPESFTIRVDADGKTYTSEQRAAGTKWNARVEPRDEPAREYAVEFSPQHEVTFDSPLFATVSLVRLHLPVGQSREVDAVSIDFGTLEPRAVKLTFACVAEEKFEVPAGKFAAQHYTVKTGGAEGEDNIWTDRNGIVLQYQSANGDVAELTRYRRIERR